MDKDSRYIVESIGITELDLKYLKSFRIIVKDNIDLITDEFYKPIAMNKTLVDIINSHSSIDRLKKIIGIHILDMFNGVVDNNYTNMREKIAKVHLKIGLSIADYMQSFDALEKVFFELLSNIQHPDDRVVILKGVSKMLNLERQLVVSAYNHRIAELEEESKIKSEQLNIKINESSNNLSSLSQQLNASLETISNQANNVVSDMKNVVSINKDVEDTIEEGKITLETQLTAMNKLINSSRNISNDLYNLKNMSLKVEEIVATISDISSRTNLLALNAQIEASRGGADGTSRAFGVIASQLRELSENVNTNVGHIESIVKDIQSRQEQLESTTISLTEVVGENKEALNKTEDKLRDITNSVNDSTKLTDNIDVQMTGLNETLKQLSEAFEVVVSEAEKLNELTLDLK